MAGKYFCQVILNSYGTSIDTETMKLLAVLGCRDNNDVLKCIAQLN